MNLKKNKNSKSLSFTLNETLKSINIKKIYNFLKNKRKNISRICIHKNSKSNLQQMFIYQKKNYISATKYHPNKDKSYLLIKGKQKILLYKKNGKLLKRIILNSKTNFCWIPKNITHANQTISQDSFHVETINGPFNLKDRVYLNE